MADIDLDSILDGALDDFDRPNAPPPQPVLPPAATTPIPSSSSPVPTPSPAAAAVAAAMAVPSTPSSSSPAAPTNAADVANAQKALMDLFGGATGAPGANGTANMSDEQLVNEMTELGKILEKMGPDDVAKLLASDPSATDGDAPSPDDIKKIMEMLKSLEGTAPPSTTSSATPSASASSSSAPLSGDPLRLAEFFNRTLSGTNNPFPSFPVPPSTTGSSSTSSTTSSSSSSSTSSTSTPAFSSSITDAIRMISDGIQQTPTGGAGGAGLPSMGDGNMDEFLSKMMSEFEKMGAGSGTPDSKENIDKMVETMMGEMISKENMYPPLKEISNRYPSWLADNRSKLPADDIKRYEAQYDCFQRICQEFEREPNDKAKIMDLMQSMQSHGSPPKDLVGALLPPGMELNGDGIPVFPGGMPGAADLPPLPDEIKDGCKNQ